MLRSVHYLLLRLVQAGRFRVGYAAAISVLVICVLAVLHDPSIAHAQTEVLQEVGAGAGLPTTPISVIVARLIRTFLSILGIIFVLILIYAGWLYMTAGGVDEKAKTAKKWIQNAIIGLIIIMTSYTITTFILNALLDAAFGGSQNSSIADQYSEPLSGSLGAGAVEDHYPERNALDIPRNTRIMVTFKNAINPASIIEGYDGNPSSTALNIANVLIYQAEELVDGVAAADIALTSAEVAVSMTEDQETFVFDPVDLLGSADEDTNYVVVLGPGIQEVDGSAAFTGTYDDGYEWTFEVSTVVDLEQPTVTSVLPRSSTDPYEKNITVSITFSEAMDPVATTGTYNADEDAFFQNIEVLNEESPVAGTFTITNGYRTIDFTPAYACDQDPCGDIIYCLPGDAELTVEAHAASVNVTETPQALPSGALFDGVVDAAGNSLDGYDAEAGESGSDGIAQGSDSDGTEDPDVSDDYTWDFSTNDDINNEVPEIVELSHGINAGPVDTAQDVEVTFSIPMKASTLTGSNVQLWPDPWYEFWFSVGSENLTTGYADITSDDDGVLYTKAVIGHPVLVSTELEGWDYLPVITNDVKSAYQICMYPAIGPASGTDAGTCAADSVRPYCCNGSPSASACSTSVPGIDLPDTSE